MALSSLSCGGNELTSLPDLAADTALRYLSCNGNQLTSLPNLSANTKLINLTCSGNQLTSLPDLSANTALEVISCSDNQLTSLPDLSVFFGLTELWCDNNQLTSLPDLSVNTELIKLSCDDNQLSNLPDLSANTALELLACSGNQLTSLPDLSANTELYHLNCSNNQFDSLDISGYTALTRVFLTDMPSLGAVCVWVLPFPPGGVTVDTTNSPNVSFSDACIVVNTTANDIRNNVTIYPNPNNGSFIISIENNQPVNAELKIFNSLGQQVLIEQIKQAEGTYTGQFDLREYPAGIYYLQVETINGVVNWQIMIE
jgi:Leucine-rich repeat (LRR) protein